EKDELGSASSFGHSSFLRVSSFALRHFLLLAIDIRLPPHAVPTPTAPSFAYLFERFPSFVQTFCYREVAEMVKQGMEPLIISIREPEEARPAEFPADIAVQYLPPGEELTAKAKQARADRSMPRAMNHTLQQWTHKEDRHRVYEALHLGPILRKGGVRHV